MARPGRIGFVPVISSLFILLMLTGAPSQAQDENEVDEATIEFGREVFLEIAQPPCGICHMLADAETRGTIGTRLDDQRPTAEEVRMALIDGPGAMPDYSEILSEEEIEAVSQYVAGVAGRD